MKRTFTGLAIVALVFFGSAGCSSDDDRTNTTSVSPNTSASVTNSLTTTSVTATPPMPPATTPEEPIGDPAPAEKQIASCATTTLYQPGTTWYTDGTSGWTQYCQDQYYAANPTSEEQMTCADGDVVNEGGGSYSTCQNGDWVYVDPTFDPDSGDGYGPNQPLPPLCVRFPDQYTC